MISRETFDSVFVSAVMDRPGSVYSKPSHAAELLVAKDGRFVYISNRGHDTIGMYTLTSNLRRNLILGLLQIPIEMAAFQVPFSIGKAAISIEIRSNPRHIAISGAI